MHDDRLGAPVQRRGRVGRLSRGEFRGLLTAALLEGPAHGYELMRRLEDASGGAWSPSPGSVYPTLQMLEEEGLLTASMEGERKTYSLTPSGETVARSARAAKKPWESESLPPGRYELRDVTHAVHIAAKQVGTEGTPEQVEKAIELMRSTRRQLYRMLAED